MTTMTIHADDPFAVALRAYAADLGKSVNQTVKAVFAPILGLAAAEPKKANPWSRFAGALPDIDCARWDASVREDRQIDPELWK